jgi:RHH-type rel operon transcriptional repressor/antitoxin RelB
LIETFEKGSILFKIKEGDDFDRRNTWQVFRGSKFESDAEIGQKGAFFKGLNLGPVNRVVIFPPRKLLYFLITTVTMYYNKIHWRQRMSKAISIRIPDDLASKLSEIAKETERPKSFHVQKALEAYLIELADLQVALDRLHDTSDPIVTTDEMRKELEL